MKTRVWLLRHAETATPAVFHGAESDIGLSDRGRRQASALGAYFAAKRPDAVISSAMRRAIDTATPIAHACGVERLTEPLLHERRVGRLGGQPHTPEHPVWTATLARWTIGDTAYTSDGAESFDAIRTRILTAWQRVTQAHAGQSIVVVGHGLACKVLMLSILPEWSVERWRQFGPIPNLAISELVGGAAGWRAESLLVVPDLVTQTM